MGSCCSNESNGESAEGEDSLVYVEIYHRHGDRVPAYFLLKESIEEGIWIPMIARQYKWIEYDSESKKVKYLVENEDEAFSWQFLNEKMLKFTTIVDMNDSKNNDDIKDQYTIEKSRSIKWKYLLTNTGVSQLNQTGKYLRQRYVDELKFLPNNLDNITQFNNNVYYQSSNDTRNIFSAESLLQELIGITKTENEDEKFPIHIDSEHHYLDVYNAESRPVQYKQLLSKNSEFVLKNNLMPEIEQLKNEILSKFNPNEDMDENDVSFYKVEDGYTCRAAHIDSDNAIIKKEKENGVIDLKLAAQFKKLQFKHSVYQIANNCKNDVETLRLAIGNQLYNLYDHLNNAKSDNYFPKCRIYSCHDNTLSTLLCALNKNEENIINLADMYEWPPYGVPMCFEEWQRQDGIKYVKVFYNYKEITIDGKNEMTVEELGQFWGDIMVST